MMRIGGVEGWGVDVWFEFGMHCRIILLLYVYWLFDCCEGGLF